MIRYKKLNESITSNLVRVTGLKDFLSQGFDSKKDYTGMFGTA